MRPLRVFLYSRVNPADRGGVQAVVRCIAAHLRRRGHTVSLGWAWPSSHASAGEATYELPRLVMRGALPAPRSAVAVARAGLRLAAGLALRRPDVVNCHFITSECLYFARLRTVFRYKLVLSAHGSDVLGPKPENAPLLPRILRSADAITAVSEPVAARVADIAGVDRHRVRIIANGVDAEFWGADLHARPMASRPPILLAVGRLHPVKGHDVLLRALAVVRSQIPDVSLVIAGGGASRGSLEQLARDLSLQDAVAFVGELDPTDVRARMSEARAFVLPSRSEGLPLTVLEAMGAGLPVVASAVGAVPEIVAPGTGILVPPDDPGALAGALLDVLRDRGEALSAERARQRARAFPAASADAGYERVITDVANRSRSSRLLDQRSDTTPVGRGSAS